MTFGEWLVEVIPISELRPVLDGWAPDHLDDDALRQWLLRRHEGHPVFVPLAMVYGDDWRHHLAARHRRRPWYATRKMVRTLAR